MKRLPKIELVYDGNVYPISQAEHQALFLIRLAGADRDEARIALIALKTGLTLDQVWDLPLDAAKFRRKRVAF